MNFIKWKKFTPRTFDYYKYLTLFDLAELQTILIILLIKNCFRECLIYRNQMNPRRLFFVMFMKKFQSAIFSLHSQWAIFCHALISFFNVIVRLKLFHGHSSAFPYVHLPGKARVISLSLTLTSFWQAMEHCI